MDNFVYPLPLFFGFNRVEKQLNMPRAKYGRYQGLEKN
jgi:hypothetical protein